MVVRTAPGVLMTTQVPGAPRSLRRLGAGRAIALGRVLAAVHARRTTATGGLPGWPSRATDPAGYARRRGADAVARARGAAERRLAERATRAAVDSALATPGDPAPFSLLHGDLVGENVVWPAAGGDPVLVDWEFWRMGDAAEDLAYLIAMNDLPAGVAGQVLGGYGADAGMRVRIARWQPLVLVDAGLWHRAHGDPPEAAGLLRRARALLD